MVDDVNKAMNALDFAPVAIFVGLQERLLLGSPASEMVTVGFTAVPV